MRRRDGCSEWWLSDAHFMVSVHPGWLSPARPCVEIGAEFPFDGIAHHLWASSPFFAWRKTDEA